MGERQRESDRRTDIEESPSYGDFSDGERRACECVRYGAIDRAIGRAKGVVLRLEKIIIDTERK